MSPAFVPVVTPPQLPSPEAQELGRRLAETIEGYRREHPNLRNIDIRQAMRLALAGRGAAMSPAAALIIGLAAAVGVIAVLLSRPAPQGGAVFPVVLVVVLALVIAIVAIRFRNR